MLFAKNKVLNRAYPNINEKELAKAHVYLLFKEIRLNLPDEDHGYKNVRSQTIVEH